MKGNYVLVFALFVILSSAFAAPSVAAAETGAGNWTGFYIGADAGWIQTDVDFYDPDYWITTPPKIQGTGKTDDAIFGIHAGYNWQVRNFVFGGEATLGYSGAENRACVGYMTGIPVTCGSDNSVSLETETKWLSTFRAKAGLDLGQFMPYISGGLAIAKVDMTADYTNVLFFTGLKDTVSQTKFGYTLGGGVEYMFTNNILLRLEGTYFDLGKSYDPFFIRPLVPPQGTGFGSDITGFTLTAGISYKF